MKILITLALCIVSTIAEPPVDNRYLPPLQGFNAAPTQASGPPRSGGFDGQFRQTDALFSSRQPVRARPSSQYGAAQPSTQYGTPLNQPSSQYGLPSRVQRPSVEYGAPGFGLGGGEQYSNGGDFGGQAANRQYLPPGLGRGGYNGAHDGSNGKPANYSFEYMVKGESGNDFGHRETRLGDRAEGLYYVLLPDGRKQTVEYEADQGGYKPKISYEDTGSVLGGYNRNDQGYNAYNTAGGPY